MTIMLQVSGSVPAFRLTKMAAVYILMVEPFLACCFAVNREISSIVPQFIECCKTCNTIHVFVEADVSASASPDDAETCESSTPHMQGSFQTGVLQVKNVGSSLAAVRILPHTEEPKDLSPAQRAAIPKWLCVFPIAFALPSQV